MLKLLWAISCAFLLPMAAGEAGAQSTPAVPWWAAIESPPAQLGLYGFIVDDLIPTVRACGPDDKFFCLAGFKGERKNGLNDGIAYYKASATDSFLGHPVRMAVVLEQSKVLAVVAVTGGAPEQERILAELTKRHGKPNDLWRRNVRLVSGGPGYEYLTAYWDLHDGEICFKGTEPPKADQTQPSLNGQVRYWSNALRSSWTCS